MKCHLKVFLIGSNGSPFVQWSVTIWAILVEGIKRNNSVKILCIWVSGSALASLLFSRAESFMQF